LAAETEALVDEVSEEVEDVVVDEEEEEVVEPAMKRRISIIAFNILWSCIMPEEDKGLVDDVGVEDAEDVRVEVTDVEVVVLDVLEEEVEEEEEEEEVVVVVMVVEEDEDVVPSSEAPFLTVKMSLMASWPAESII
jgi:hypothetical protein